MFVPDKSKTPVIGGLVEFLGNLPHIRYFGELEKCLGGLSNSVASVKKREQAPLGGHVYSMGVAVPDGRKAYKTIYGVLYRGSQSNKPDNFDGVVTKREKVDGSLSPRDLEALLYQKLALLRKQHDIPQKRI